jgi:TRAP-type mannitol/chloroaromatic compound transport system permease small subunit
MIDWRASLNSRNMLFRSLDRALECVCSAAAWLSIPIMLALALQWPLRDWLGRYSREVNDLGQCLFALYVAVGVTAASRAGAHLAAHSGRTASAHMQSLPRRAMRLLGVVPWCVWVLWQGAALTQRSTLSLERFPDTFNHGYFVIKLAMWLLALLLLLHALMEVAGDVAPNAGSTQEPSPASPP